VPEIQKRLPSMLRNVNGGAPGRRCQRSRSADYQHKNIDSGPLGGADEDPGVPTINTKKCRRRAPWEAVLEIREHQPSTQKNINGGPPWEVLMEIREHPPSTLRSIDGRPPRRRCRRCRVPTINMKNVNCGPPER
jgi:hypothetical protein